MYGKKYLVEKTVQMILQQFFKDEKTKINNEALELITEVITLFVEEAVSRTSRQAQKDGDTELSLEHFEKILPQLIYTSFFPAVGYLRASWQKANISNLVRNWQRPDVSNLRAS